MEYVAQKYGKLQKNGETIMNKADFLRDIDVRKIEATEKILLDLRRKNLIGLFPSADGEEISFATNIVLRIKKIHEWLPRFEMEVSA